MYKVCNDNLIKHCVPESEIAKYFGSFPFIFGLRTP